MSLQNDQTAPQPNDDSAPAGKRLFGVGMLALGIAAGAMFAPATFAGAQDDADDVTETTRHGHRNHRGEVLQSLGLDAGAIGAGVDAGQSLVEVAEANGVSEAELIAVIEADIQIHVADAVESGRLTQDEADAKLAELTTGVSERVNAPLSERSERSARGNRVARGEVLEALGLAVDDIEAGRESGQTLAETAATIGVNEDELVAALVAQATERAEAAVDAGRIDADRAAEVLEGLDERITERVNAEPSERAERSNRGQRGQRDGAVVGGAEETSTSF